MFANTAWKRVLRVPTAEMTADGRRMTAPWLLLLSESLGDSDVRCVIDLIGTMQS
jgi:hypothetical protein